MTTPATRDRARPERFSVSALYADRDTAERAVVRLHRAGIPRDLLEVVVSPRAAERFFPDAPPPPRREAFRYAGIGALIGLITGAFVSLVIVLLPGFQEPGLTAIVQLLGPNLFTVGGALAGAIFGLFARRRPARHHARAAEAPDSIVLVVTIRSPEEAGPILDLLRDTGGLAPRLGP